MRKNFQRTLLIMMCVLMVLNSLSFCVFASSTEQGTTLSLTPASTQQRRMWSNKTYNSADYVYEPWNITYWGRVNYIRFASNEIVPSRIKKATINLDARARESEKTVYLAAVALSDSSALKVETDVTSLSSTKKVTSTGSTTKADKLMINTSGNYYPEIASSVCAYTKTTASDVATEDNIYGDTIVYNYPLEIELDVTESVRSAFEAGNHAQFVLTPAKQVLTSANENLYSIENFGSYANGVIYDESGNVIKETDDALSLDTSTTVCGTAGYYTSDEINDTYFSWLYMVRDSISLEVEYYSDDEMYALFKEKTGSAEELNSNIDSISYLLNQDSWEIYEKLRLRVNASLYEALKESTGLSAFQTAFAEIVQDAQLNSQPYELQVTTDFGGRRGAITVDGIEQVPEYAYALIKIYDNESTLIESYTADVKNGKGFFNIIDNDSAAKVDITLTSDEKGETPISAVKSVILEDFCIPEVFITEISNMHSNTYYPDDSSQNSGDSVQPYQYIELYNYGETSVDLSNYSFVYHDTAAHTFSWVKESGGSMILEPGEIYIIGVYSADSAALGHGYNGDGALAEYWNGFNAFYGTDIPMQNRVLIPCVESGNASSTLDGISQLKRSSDAGTTVWAELKKGSATVTKISMADDNNPETSYAYQYIPSENETEEEYLFCTGCFPYQLLDEQKLDYCEKVYCSDADEIKVMSYNVLATNETGRTVAARYPLFVKTLENYDIDIVGMQEVNYLWVNQLKANAPEGYAYVEGYSRYGNTYDSIRTNTTWDLMNPIYYKKDKYTLLESGAAFMTPDGNMSTQQWDSINMKRTMTWAVLQDNSTGSVISAINTHVVLSGKQARVEQVKLLYKKGEELQKKYGGGIVIVGDHNFREGTEPYQEYMNSGVVVDAKFQTTNHNSVNTAETFGEYSKVYGSPIDYCFISPNEYAVQKYEVFDGVYPEGIVSDHSAIYVELLDKEFISEKFDLDSEYVRYVGRNDTNNAYGRTVFWPGAGFEFKFTGSSADIYVNHLVPAVYFNVIIDGGSPKRILLTEGWNNIVENLTEGEHTVTFIRSSEGKDGRVYFGQIRTKGAAPVPTEEPKRRIEFYGDSFTAGYGNLETNMSAVKSAVNTDNYYSYASVASRALGAESSILAYSGAGAAINFDGSTTNTVPQLTVYGDVSDGTQTLEPWDYNKFTPQVVVVFLGINDHLGKGKSTVTNTTSYITQNYKAFITSLRGKYPNANILLCSRPTNCSKDCVDAVYNELSTTDSKLHRFIFDPCTATGLKSHPTVAQHKVLAEQLVAKIESIEDVWQENVTISKYELVDAKLTKGNDNKIISTTTAKKIAVKKDTPITAIAAAFGEYDAVSGEYDALLNAQFFTLDTEADETPLTFYVNADDVKVVKWFVIEADGSLRPVATSQAAGF